MHQVEHVLGVQSAADWVADEEYKRTGIRQIPPQERIDEILASAGTSIAHLMPDRGHTRIIIGMPTTSTLTEEQRNRLLLEIENAVDYAEFPSGYGVTITGDPSFQAAIVQTMNSTNGQILVLCGVLMIVALLLFFRHVRWSLLPLPVVLLGIVWTLGAMGLLHIRMGMTTFAAFPIMIGIGIDYAIQFHNRIDEELSKGKSVLQASTRTVKYVAIPVLVALTVTERASSPFSSFRPIDPGLRKDVHDRPGHVLPVRPFVNLTIPLSVRRGCPERRWQQPILRMARQLVLSSRALPPSALRGGRRCWHWLYFWPWRGIMLTFWSP